jgi:hypothetical protein
MFPLISLMSATFFTMLSGIGVSAFLAGGGV